MTDKEMALEVGKRLLKYQVHIQALKAQLRTFKNSDGQSPEPWGEGIDDSNSFEPAPFALLWEDRCSQLQRALDVATPDAPLIHILHHHHLVERH
jgi:hypothetical protein